MEQDLDVSRLTATKYPHARVREGFLMKRKVGRPNYDMNAALYEILTGEHLTPLAPTAA